MGVFNNLLGGKRLPILEGMDSIIGENARFKGELVTGGSVSINGEFEGRVRAEGEVIVSSSGKVAGELHGGSVEVSGRVDGNITARDSLEISRLGRVHGDITGGKIIIEAGSSYHGRVKVESQALEEEPEGSEEPIAASASETSQPQIFPEI